MPQAVTVEFDEKNMQLIISDKTGTKPLWRVPVTSVYHYPTKEEV